MATDSVESAVERYYDQFQDRVIPVSARPGAEDYSLKTALVYEGEILFFYQIYRLSLSTQLQDLVADETLRWVSAESVSSLQAMQACVQMIVALAEDEKLRQEILGEYKTYLPHMYLYHGDRERYKRHFPKSSTAPTAILNNFRPQQMLAIQKITREYTIRDTMQRYEEAQKRRFAKLAQKQQQQYTLTLEQESEHDDPEGQATHELEFSFLLRCVTQVWFTFQQLPERRALQEAFVLEEMPYLTDRNQTPQLYQTRVKQAYTSATTLDTISDLLAQFRLQCTQRQQQQPRRPMPPRLVRLQRLYYVLDMQGCQVLGVETLVEAYVHWMRLLLQQRYVTTATLHTQLRQDGQSSIRMERDPRAVVRQRISTEFMIDITNYCDGDMDINNCKRKKQHEMFRYQWAVGLESPLSGQFTELSLFNTPQFKLALRKFLSEAHDALDRFRFFGYYYAKDMEGWFQALLDSATASYRLRQQATREGMAATTSDEQKRLLRLEKQQQVVDVNNLAAADLSSSEEEEEEEIDAEGHREILETVRNSIVSDLPFGVIPLSSACGSTDYYGHYYMERHRGLMRGQLVYECTDEQLAQRYNFGVYDTGAQFILCSDPQCKVRCREEDQFKSLSPDDLIPQTPYLDLYIQKSLLDEAEETQFDANSMLAYPELFLVAKLPVEKRVENVSSHVLSIEQSMLGGQLHDQGVKHAIALNTANQELENIRQNTNSGLVRARKLRYNRPSMKDAMEPISAMVDISQNRAPSTILNVQQLRQHYENTICSVMNMPYFFVKQHTSGNGVGGGGGSASSGKTSGGGATGASSPYNKQLELSQKLLEDEIKKEHTQLSEIFKEIYNMTFVQLFGAPLVSAYNDGHEEPALSFDRVIVKNDDALINLLKFHEVGLVKDAELRAFIATNYGLSDEFYQSGASNRPAPMKLPAKNNDKEKKKKRPAEEKKDEEEDGERESKRAKK